MCFFGSRGGEKGDIGAGKGGVVKGLVGDVIQRYKGWIIK